MKFDNLLDIAPGHHRHEWLQYYGLADEVTAVDIEKLSGSLDANLFIRHDCETPLPFSDQFFDMVFSDHTIEHLHNSLGFYKEIQRVFKTIAIIKTPQGWMEKFFLKPRRRHFSRLNRQWFVDNLNPGIVMATRINIKRGPFEIEVTLRRLH